MYRSNCFPLTLLLLLSAVQMKGKRNVVTIIHLLEQTFFSQQHLLVPVRCTYQSMPIMKTLSLELRGTVSTVGTIEVVLSKLHEQKTIYIHCEDIYTPFRLTDSDYGSEHSDYYSWLADKKSSQLLFIFPTRFNLTNITLHYYHTSGRGLLRLKFYAVPDDFDVWDAPTALSHSLVDVAIVPPSGEPAGHRNIRISFDNIHFSTTKTLFVNFSSSYTFQLSRVEFIRSFCSSQQVNTSTMRVLTKASVYLTTLYATSTFSTTELKSRNM